MSASYWPYGHQTHTAGASELDVPTDRFTCGLTYFSRSQDRGENVKSNFWSTTVAQIITDAHRDLQSCIHRAINGPSSHTKNYSSV